MDNQNGFCALICNKCWTEWDNIWLLWRSNMISLIRIFKVSFWIVFYVMFQKIHASLRHLMWVWHNLNQKGHTAIFNFLMNILSPFLIWFDFYLHENTGLHNKGENVFPLWSLLLHPNVPRDWLAEMKAVQKQCLFCVNNGK